MYSISKSHTRENSSAILFFGSHSPKKIHLKTKKRERMPKSGTAQTITTQKKQPSKGKQSRYSSEFFIQFPSRQKKRLKKKNAHQVSQPKGSLNPPSRGS